MKRVILKCGCHSATDDGRVWTRLLQFSRGGAEGIQTIIGDEWRPMSGCKTAKGYFQVALHGKSVRVNRIIATAFVENPNNLPESQHIDGNRENNTADNLKWGEPKENANDRSRHGRTVVGSRSPNAKLSEALVLKIRALRPIKTLQSLADEFGVSKKLVLLVTQNKAWRHA